VAHDPYPWTRREGESEPAYDAFRMYLNMGADRTYEKVSEQSQKSTALIAKWGRLNKWRARVLAYDQHMETAATDGHAEEMRRVRQGHLQLSEKLLDHLDRRLDEYITANADPSVRWTQAFSAATKAQEAALRMKETGKESGMLERAIEMLERIQSQAERP